MLYVNHSNVRWWTLLGSLLTQEFMVSNLELNSKILEYIKKPSLLGFFFTSYLTMQALPYNQIKIVLKEMCDHNGHMNVNYYYQLFDSVYTVMYLKILALMMHT